MTRTQTAECIDNKTPAGQTMHLAVGNTYDVVTDLGNSIQIRCDDGTIRTYTKKRFKIYFIASLSPDTEKRWNVKIAYRTEKEPLIANFGIDELEELQTIIEAGWDFNTIIDIQISYAIGSETGLTIEQSIHQ